MKISGSRMMTAAGIVTMLSAVAIWFIAAPVVRAQSERFRAVPNPRVQVFGSGLGVTLEEVESSDVTRLKLPSASGALVKSVRSDGPAGRAGFKTDDVVVSFDGQPVRSVKQLTRLIEETPDGREVEAVVLRDGARVNLKVAPSASDTLEKLFYSTGPMRQFQFSGPGGNGFVFGQPLLGDRFGDQFNMFGADPFSGNTARLGVTVQELTGQLGDFFGTKDGVLVTSVEEGTPAKTVGLKAGDVITKINNRVVTSPDDLRRRITGVSGDVTISIVRDRKDMAVTVKLDGEAARTIIK